MTKRLLMDAIHPAETRVAILDEDSIEHFDFVSTAKRQMKGNIYLGKITRVEPSLQAAFVEYGSGKQGFLSFSEIHPDYYQIPIADRQRLMEEAAQAAEEEERRAEAAYARGEEEEDEPQLREEEHEHPDEAPDEHYETKVPEGEQSAAPLAEAMAEPLPIPETPAEAETPAQEFAPDATTEELPEGAYPSGEGDAEPAEQAADGERSEGEDIGEGPRRHGRRRGFGAKAKQSRSSARNLEASESGDEEGDDRPIETVSEEDAEHEIRKPRPVFTRRYKIQEVIKPNQIVLVQVVKEERGNKGCSLSTFISLPGRYCVLMPNSPKDGGISRKIGSNSDRKRLKDIAAELKESRGMSAIIRTAGIDRTKAEIKRDYEYLIKLWGQTRDLALGSTAPAIVYEEGNLVKRTIRDYYNGDIDEVLVQGDEAYKSAKDFMKMIMPSHAARVKQFKDPQPIFHAYGVEEQLAELYHPVAPLPSGGYLVINPTEALISVDVNSGRSTTERNVEETAYKTNLEAAEEVARQLRLRDLGGLVVIDFIDMGYGKHRRAVEKALKDAMKDDRAKVQVGHISAFGLLELSRQRLGASILEATTHDCPHCKGVGRVRSPEATAMAVLRELESEAFDTGAGEYRLRLSIRDAIMLMNRYREQIGVIEKQYGITVCFEIDPALAEGVFTLDNGRGGGSHHKKADSRPARRRSRGGRSKSGGGRDRGPASGRPLLAPEEGEVLPEEIEEDIGEEAEGEARREPREPRERQPRREGEGDGERGDGTRRRRSRRGRRGGQRARGGRDAEGNPTEQQADQQQGEALPEQSDHAPESGPAADGEARPPRRRSRGGRGRGRRDGAPREPRIEGEVGSEPRGEGEAQAPRRSREPREPRERPAAAEAARDPQPAAPRPAAATAAPAPSLHTPIAKPEAGDASKRKGWWSKITG